jgi:predicted amidohydrolase
MSATFPAQHCFDILILIIVFPRYFIDPPVYRTYDSLSAREEFYTYSHRGKAVLALRKLAGVGGPQTVVGPSASSASKSSKKSE